MLCPYRFKGSNTLVTDPQRPNIEDNLSAGDQVMLILAWPPGNRSRARHPRRKNRPRTTAQTKGLGPDFASVGVKCRAAVASRRYRASPPPSKPQRPPGPHQFCPLPKACRMRICMHARRGMVARRTNMLSQHSPGPTELSWPCDPVVAVISGHVHWITGSPGLNHYPSVRGLCERPHSLV